MTNATSADQLWSRDLAAPTTGVSARWLLAGIVVAGVVAHALLAFLRLLPTAFPDEYLYAALGRSLAAAHLPAVRGTPAHFPALLEPLLTAPAWLLPRIELSVRAIQAVNATAVAIAAIPAYLLARRLRLAQGSALAVAALTIVVPQLALAGQVLSEPIAYPLALGAVAAGVAMVERPNRRTMVVFLGLAALAAAARVQLAVLPACVLVAVVVDGVRTGGVRTALSRQRALVALLALQGTGALALVASGHLGYYANVLPSGSALAGSWKIAPADLYVVLLSTGVALAPAGLVGTGLALVRPRTRAEGAFGVLATTFVAALFAQACLYGDTGLLQERYLLYAVPLIGVSFALRASRWPRSWIPEAAVAAAIAIFAAAVPLAGYVAAQTSPAPVEAAIRRLQLSVGDTAAASLLVAIGATVLAGLAVAVARRRRFTAGIWATSLVVAGTLLVSAVSYGRKTNLLLRESMPADLSWIDHSGVRHAAFLAAPGTQRSTILETLFWNRSVDDVLLLPGAKPPDKFAAPRLKLGPTGALLLGDAPIRRPFVFDHSQTTAAFRDARRVRATATQSLWRPQGHPRLAALMWGRAPSGRLLPTGGIRVWTDRGAGAGWIELRLRPADSKTAGSFALFDDTGQTFAAQLGAREVRQIRLPFCGGKQWTRDFTAQNVVSSAPRYRPDPHACGSAQRL